MTVADVINEFNSVRENNVDDALKQRWLLSLEKKIMVDVFRKYDGIPDEAPKQDFWVDEKGCLHCPDWVYVDADGNLVIDSKNEISMDAQAMTLTSFLYVDDDGNITLKDIDDDEFSMESELSLPDAFADIYLYYLGMKIAFFSNDSRMYNMYAQEYNNNYLAFQQFFARTHTLDRPRGHLIDHRRL